MCILFWTPRPPGQKFPTVRVNTMSCTLRADEQCQSPALSRLPHGRRQPRLRGTVRRPVVLGSREPRAARGRHCPPDVVVRPASTGRARASGHFGAGVRLAPAGRHGRVQLLTRYLTLPPPRWLRGPAVECRSFAIELSLSCSRPVADG